MPRPFVQLYLKERDPEGCERHKRHKLKRRQYINTGPDAAWHIDGYDKMKPWGFPIHGAIDGYSRKVLWLNVARSNNSPHNIAKFYLNCVGKHGGCPMYLITDLGTENGIAASIQCYFRSDSSAHRYVSSPRNQQLESWWSMFSKQRASWWRAFFQDLESQGIYDSTSDIPKEALWFCFHKLFQKELDYIKEHWNSHYIRKSRHDTVAGRPDLLYNIPENYGGESNLKAQVPAEKNAICLWKHYWKCGRRQWLYQLL